MKPAWGCLLIALASVVAVPVLVVGVVMFCLAPPWMDACALVAIALGLGWFVLHRLRRSGAVPGHEGLNLRASKDGLL